MIENFQLRIDKLHIKNFRQFEDLDISFDKDLTVLIAENGGGKTTILDCLGGMLLYLTEQIRFVPRGKEPFLKTDIRWGSDNIANTLVFESAFLKPLSVQYDARTESSRFNFEELTQDEIEDMAQQDVEEVASNNISYNESFLSEIGKESQAKKANLPLMVYYSCGLANLALNNAVSNGTNPRSLETFDTYNHALLDTSVLDFKRLKKWLIWKYLQEQESKDKTFDIIRQALVGETGIMNEPNRQIFTDLRVTYRENPEGDFVFFKKDIPLFESQLSSGERTLMILVADLARRAAIATPLSKNPLQDATGVVLIDEIDLHLHPKAQRKVVPILCKIFPKVQFVVTTHSPFVIASLEPKHICLLTEDMTTQQKIVTNVEKAHKHTKGLEPNRIIKEIMGTPLRDFDIQEKMRILNILLKNDTENPKVLVLLTELTDTLGKEDSFIMRVQHEMMMLKRKKQTLHEVH